MAGKARSIPPQAIKALVFAMVAETICIGGGVAAYLATDRVVWIIIGVVAGTGFSIPALLTFLKASKGQ